MAVSQDIICPFQTVPSLLEARAKETPQKPYLIFQEEEVSYSQFRSSVRKMAAHFQTTGAGHGSRVAILIPNSDHFLYCYFGAMEAGLAAATLNTLLKAEELEFIINDCEAEILCTTPHYRKLLDPVFENLKNIKHVIFTEPGDLPHSALIGDILKGNAEYSDPNVTAADDAAMIYTSGTTGHPKGVVLTHSNVMYNSYVAPRFIDLQAADVSLCIMPLFHVNAQIASMLATMQAGATVVLEEMFKPRTFIKTLKKHRCTTFSGVPTIFNFLNEMKEAEGEDLSFLKACICGAAPMPVEVFQTFERKFGAKIIEGYGLSEGTCVSSLNPLNGVRKIGSIGIPIDGQDMSIWDDDANEMPAGQTGEIVIKGPNVMKEYYRNPEATAKTLHNGWLRTGDLGYRDQDGYYFIVGRKKEMIIRGGENIYPREIEEVLYENPEVQDCAVVGLPDKKYGEEVAAFIILKGGSSADEKTIKSYLRAKIADFKRPRIIEIVTELPRTATGKIQKNKIIEEFVGNQELISRVNGKVLIPYRWVYGKALSRFYTGLREEGKFYGTARKGCEKCNGAVQLPPKSFCGLCHEECNDWVEVPNRGVVESFTTVYMEFPGQPTKPPYTYGYIKMEGTATHLYHMIREIEEKDIHIGLKVEAVWAPVENRRGNLHDIQYFRPLGAG
ncbi:MAG TPA: long-chain-fatty-acid--CoA ligase [Leptospiraceae bacterium]|nr:long-chain-fatty-acid--CoA ligase [Leptospirales bacterium]HMX54899.1 long-chain-fatty-acid--CoA ligase [Leptospiraceae bacterium]HNK99600.1 long-chain-fatty-acid--CoA ligase [Leptospiraceae bacterium]HNN74964.1 long-chain-fatty-acid--CoA ligase [Leptospiraceae bacterium]